ncbi:MAG: family 16 glycosylhydrolase [Phycisphaerales bacterium JB040]
MHHNRIANPIHTGLLVLGLSGMSCLAQPTLIWSDEFDGTSLDLTKWEPMIGNGQAYGISGWGNNELQYYTNRSQNITVANGELTITARRENYQGYQYTSARLRTMGKADFTYGRMEARLKLPSTQGIWPAFWMLPTNSPYGGWAAGGEIDIMEKINDSSVVHGTIHYGGQWPNNTNRGAGTSPGVDLVNTFHTYAIEWDEDSITWFFDGQPYNTINATQWYSENAPGDPNAPFDVPFHFLLNVAVGGNWPGYPDGSSVFPQRMVVDYVRVYSLSDEPVAQQPFNPSVLELPGRLEMEEYDLGGQGVAYSDADSQNQGGAFRPGDGVDIENTTGGGYNIGYVRPNEWTEYTVDFPKTGTYLLRARYASNSIGGTFGFSIDGQDVSGDITGLTTGGWQSWTTLDGQIQIDQTGEQVLRWENRSTATQFEYNLDWVEFFPRVMAMAEPATLLDNGDIQAFVANFLAFDPVADFNGDGVLDNADIGAFVQEYLAWIN